MADWIQTHSFISCKNHETALRIYQRFELRGGTFDGGLRWGFWDPKTVLVCSTMRWGWDAEFVDDIVSGLDVICIHENEVEIDPVYENRVREILGVKKDFLWSNCAEVLAELLDKYESFETGLTTLAIFNSVEEAKAFVVTSHDNDVLRGFLTAKNQVFVVGRHDFSPLENPLIAPRIAGVAWSILADLDGSLLPTNPCSVEELWKMERHGGYGLFQPIQQRNSLVRNALTHKTSGEQLAGAEMARRWDMSPSISTLTEKNEKSIPWMRGKKSELGERVLSQLNLKQVRSAEEIENARNFVNDETFGAATRWLLASQKNLCEEHVRKIVNSSFELFEISELFLERIQRPKVANAFIHRVTEIAYTITRCSYWKVSYGVPGKDRVSAVDSSWNGDPAYPADQIGYWADQIIQTLKLEREPRQHAIRVFVAMNQLLQVCRSNRSFWIPAIGLLQRQLICVLTEQSKPGDVFLWNPENWIEFEKQFKHLGDLYRESKTLEKRIELQQLSSEIIDGGPDFLDIWQYASFGQLGLRWLTWIANNLAWTLYEDGDSERALKYGEIAFYGANWNEDCYRDTYVCILVELGRKAEAFRIVYAAIGRGSEEFGVFSKREDYQNWVRTLEMK